MSRLFQSAEYISSCSSDSDNELSSDDDETESVIARANVSKSEVVRKIKTQNVIQKLYNRERTGFFSDRLNHKDRKIPFARVPRRLSFCLKEIVPYCYLTGHVFMGLTICGQFLLSYKIISDEDSVFSSTYKYELYFWIYRPHSLLCKYFTVCLFDDHGVNNIKNVTMAQWKSNPRVLIVHGGDGYDNEDSYFSIVAVPNLCCRDCKRLRDDFCLDAFDPNRCGILCIKCNLTIHTKYCRAESDPKFNSLVNLQCVDRILIIANGLIHMINVDLELNRAAKSRCNSIDVKYIRRNDRAADGVDSETRLVDSVEEPAPVAATTSNIAKPMAPKTGNASAFKEAAEPKNIVDKIIADFAECETESFPNEKHFPNSSHTFFSELVITCGSSSKPSSTFGSSRVRLLNHRSSRIMPRGVQSTTRIGPTKIDFSSTTAQLSIASGCSTSSAIGKTLDNKAANAYEFSEDNEKCEKISTFRKRRLADKKYEFSEDNTENIIPYTKMRSVVRNPSLAQKFSTQSPVHSPPAIYDFNVASPHHTHRASPSYGFRSPCGSPVGNRLMMMSPPARSYFSMKSPSCTRVSTMSPRSNQSTIKRPYYIDALLENYSNHVILSPRSDDCDISRSFIQPLSEVKPSNVDIRANQMNPIDSRNVNQSDADKPMCSIKLIRRYVDEDDAASVITSEEDDCISPGYHTSLPLEVHGAGYSDMQMISKTSYKKLLCPTVTVTQTTFDLEAFTYYAVNYLCSINNKKYGFFFDCACEIIRICPLSCVLTCILMAHFTANDIQPDSSYNNCVNCTSNLNLECVFHRKHYECQILFTWDVEVGEWNVIDYGNLFEVSPSLANGKIPSYIHRIANKLATDMAASLTAHHEVFSSIHVLDSCLDKSKKVLKDVDNSIEFFRTSQHRRSHDYDNSDIE